MLDPHLSQCCTVFQVTHRLPDLSPKFALLPRLCVQLFESTEKICLDQNRKGAHTVLFPSERLSKLFRGGAGSASDSPRSSDNIIRAE